MMKLDSIFALSCLLCLGATPAFAAESSISGPAKNKHMTAQVVYHNYCSVCHGDRGDGKSRAQHSLNPGPRDFTSPEAAHKMTRNKMIDIVANGSPKTAMVPWKSQLSQKQIEEVVDYIRTAFMRASSTDPVAERGRSIYARSCSVCHGDSGNGKSWTTANLTKPPADFTDPQVRTQLTRNRMIAAVANGRPDTAMPGFSTQLSKQDIEVVVDYIRNSFMKAGSTEGISGTFAHGTPGEREPKKTVEKVEAAVAVDMRAAMPKGLKGDYARGEGFYKNNCATCHGETGDGRGPRAYFINPKPRNFLHAASRAKLNRPALFKQIGDGILGTEMPAWKIVLTDQQLADVSEYTFRRFISSGK